MGEFETIYEPIQETDIGFRERVNKKAERWCNLSEDTKRANFEYFCEQVAKVKAKGSIAGENTLPIEGVVETYAVDLGPFPDVLASVWEFYFGYDKALRQMKHEISHATVIEDVGMIPTYKIIIYITEGPDQIRPVVHYDLPEGLTKRQEAQLIIKMASAPEDPSKSDFEIIEKYQRILEENQN